MEGIREKLAGMLLDAGLKQRFVAKEIDKDEDEYDSSEYFDEIDSANGDVERSEYDDSSNGFFIEFDEDCGNQQVSFDVTYSIEYEKDKDALTCEVSVPSLEDRGMQLDIDTIEHYTDDYQFVGGGTVEKALKNLKRNQPEVYDDLKQEYEEILPSGNNLFSGKGKDYDELVKFIKAVGKRARDFIHSFMYLTESKKQFVRGAVKNPVKVIKIARRISGLGRKNGIGFG